MEFSSHMSVGKGKRTLYSGPRGERRGSSHWGDKLLLLLLLFACAMLDCHHNIQQFIIRQEPIIRVSGKPARPGFSVRHSEQADPEPSFKAEEAEIQSQGISPH